MNFEAPAGTPLTPSDKEAIVRSLFQRGQAPQTKAPAGVFNPTRTDLLKTFRLDEPIVRGSGHRLFDAQGREYLDFLAQYGAVPFGQNPPELWDIIRRSEAEQLVSMIQPLIPVYAQRLAERLAAITPGDLDICTFTNSGAEAVEAAIKLARVRTGRRVILSTINGFHGKTMGALSATGRPMYQKPFGVPVPHFDYVPFGDLDALAQRLEQDRGDIAAFIVEPIQGEGGIVPAPPGYLAAAFDLCRRHGVLVIADEIQTGLGRTGSLFALPADAGTPDILLLAKALGGGLFPIGACIARRDVWDDRFGLLHSSTFANNNLACRVAIGVLDLLEREDGQIVRHVANEGQYLIDRLRELQEKYPHVIKAVRGKGFMVGLEFHHIAGEDGSGILAFCSMNDGLIALFSSYLFNTHRIVTAPTFNSSHVMRLQPPLTVGRPEIDKAIDAVGDLCDALDRMDCRQLFHHLVDPTPAHPRHAGQNYSTRRRRKRPVVAPATSAGADGKFAFLLHYTSEDDILRTDRSFAAFTGDQLGRWKEWAQSLGAGVVHHLNGIRSAAGSEAEGWLIALPMVPRDMLKLGRQKSVELLDEARELAEARGANVIGLGGFTAIISRGGQDLVGKGMAITSGNTLTSIMTINAIEEAARKTGLNLAHATTAVVGATGSIGRLVSMMLASRVGALTLVGNPGRPDALERCRVIANEISSSVSADAAVRLPVQCSVDLESALADADLVVAATSADAAHVSLELLRPGTLVCDVARPANVAEKSGRDRNVLIFDGGLVQLPQPITLGPIEGLAPGVCWGCLGETILLALERDGADWSIGPTLTLAGADRMAGIAQKHGVQLAPLQRFGYELTEDDFLAVRTALAATRPQASM
jgi:acetylornithine/succinyldiaminopimelate/putrescine aminotransferase/predicted amino acid dehydrogenase